jgi:hypothetical protein
VNGNMHGIERGYDKEKTSICYIALHDRDQELVFVASNTYKEVNYASE